ncbi:MAG: hypothetical protein NC338_01615 [Firmicutes bacterium]|nr:hypothetical protein [Bacillota bacterium]MCM1401089.1 hypothetical protein [Bacteroides sp.]MCM1477008.1 hypothetical protein [Bacteroides sp.]
MSIASITDKILNRTLGCRAAVALMALTLGLTGAAQEELNQEITVEHHEEVKPTDAVRLNVSPTVEMPALSASRLSYGTRQVKVNVPASLATLAPAAYGDTIYRSPFKGYASLGYLPAFNLGASAGYKFIDNDRVRLNGWFQYDGMTYRGDMPLAASPFESVRIGRNTASVGAALHSAIGRQSFLDVGVDYTFSRYNTPAHVSEETDEGADSYYLMKKQNVHRVNLSGLWTMNTGKWNTGLGLGYGHFAYGNHIPALEAKGWAPALETKFDNLPGAYNPARENKLNVNAFASGKMWGAESTGLLVDLSYLNYGNHALLSPEGVFEPAGSRSHALLSLRPFYRTSWKRIDLDLGVNIDLTFNNGKAFHISPAAQATWKPVQIVALYAKANGGERQNTLGSLFDVCRYTLPNLVYNNSHVVVDGEVGVTVGTFKGFYSQLSLGYAIANEWLMPVNINSFFSIFDKVDMKGYKFHIGAGYQYKNLGELSAMFEMAPRKFDRGYYLWRDRAKYVAEVKLRVSPLKQLDVNLAWEFRGGRRTYNVAMPATAPDALTAQSLGTVNSFSLGGDYRLTNQWTVWANIENLFNHRYALTGAIPAQGINGLVGATYKF